MDTKKLRQKILDLAIRGKLVPQDPNDEPASVLLERIRAEKEQLIKEGKIKRSKKSAATDKSHYENVPFEIPESWCWTTLGELFDIVSAKRVLQSDWQRTGIPFYRAREIVRLSYEGYVDNDLFITEEHYNNLKKSYGVPEPSDIMLSAVGTIGRAYVVRNNDVFYYKDASVLCLRNVYHLNSEFIKWILSSDLLQNQMYENSKGTTVDTITIEKANSYFLPLPPIDEQYRIVKLLCEWDAYINDINKNKEEVLNNIRTCKSKILNLAISGKLVPQDPNDEPAIELLKRINPGFKTCDNSHYENMAIPQSWELVSLNSVVDIISGVSYAKSDIKESGVRILRGGNIQDGEIICLEDDVFIDQSYSNMVNSVVKGDIVLVASTGSPTLIGKTGYARITYPDTQIGAFLRIIRPKSSEISAFLNLIFNSDFYKNYIRSLAKGTNINNVKNGYIEQFEIALPPIQEQERIVMMVENIFISLDNITAGLL